jgi:hypothetical protein
MVQTIVVAQGDDVASSAEAMLYFSIVGRPHARRGQVVPRARVLETLDRRRRLEHEGVSAERGGRVARVVHHRHGDRRGYEPLHI